MKTETIIGIIGTIILVVFIGITWNTYTITPSAQLNEVTLSNQQVQNQLQEAVNSGSFTLDTALISQHSNADSCWLLISGKVYDVTQYLQLHPGGRAIILPFCGKEATAAFDTKAGGGSHSNNAISQLGAFLIGDLNMLLTELPVNSPALSNTAGTVNTNQEPSPAPVTPVPTSITLDSATVARHDNSRDCWLIINNSVYAVTSYLARHPGGQAIIVPFCGKDATAAFATQAGSGSHSNSAVNQLAAFKIGVLGSTTTVQDVQQIQQNTNNLPAQGNGEDESEEENEEEEEDD